MGRTLRSVCRGQKKFSPDNRQLPPNWNAVFLSSVIQKVLPPVP